MNTYADDLAQARRSPRFEGRDSHRPFHRRRRSCALHRPPRNRARRKSNSHQRRSSAHVENSRKSRWSAHVCVRRNSHCGSSGSFAILAGSLQAILRSQSRRLAHLRRFARFFLAAGRDGRIKACYDRIKAFSETDFTEDLKKFDVPTLVLHGDDDQIVPIVAAGLLSSKIIKGATLKIIPGAPHGMCSTLKDQINEELLAFIKTERAISA